MTALNCCSKYNYRFQDTDKLEKATMPKYLEEEYQMPQIPFKMNSEKSYPCVVDFGLNREVTYS